MRLKRRAVPVRSTEQDPKVTAIEDAVIKHRIAKEATENLEAVKNDLKTHVFPFGEPVGETSWRYTFPEGHKLQGASVTYSERSKPHLDIEAATKILKSKKLYSKSLTTPEPPPPPPPYIDEDKIMQFLSEGKLTKAEVKQMIKVSKKDIVKAITIADSDREKKGAKTKSRKKG